MLKFSMKRYSKKYSSQPEVSNTDEETDSDTPVFGSFYNESSSEGIQKMTTISTKEFHILRKNFGEYIIDNWKIGQRKNYTYTAKDVPFILLTVLKNDIQLEFLGGIFSIKGTTLERLILNFISCTVRDIYNTFVDSVDGEYPMKKKISRH